MYGHLPHPLPDPGDKSTRYTACLDAALPAVVVLAEHLAVIRNCLATLGPGSDVVCLHPREFEVFAAHGTDSLLPFVGLPLHIVRELADAQMAFVAIKYVGVDASLLG